jgi:hypothetical protein
MQLRFNKGISPGDPVYSHFKDAVELLLKGQITVAPGSTVNGLIIEPIVTVSGPLPAGDAPALNRAFNRLMWGLQRRRPGDHSSTYEAKVIDRQLNGSTKNDDPWADEHT